MGSPLLRSDPSAGGVVRTANRRCNGWVELASLIPGAYTGSVLALEVFADFIRKLKRETGVFASYATSPALPPQR